MKKTKYPIAKSYSVIGKERINNLPFPITSLCLRTDRIKNFANIENMKNKKFFIPFKTRSFEGRKFSISLKTGSF